MSGINYPYLNFLSTVVSLPVIDTNTVLGNVSGSSALATQLSTTQLTALINTFSSLSGTVPGSSGGTTNFLRADGTFNAPPSSPAPDYGILLDTQATTAGTSSLIFTTGLSTTYVNYEFILTNVVPVTNAVTLQMQVSQDSGATWLSANYINTQATVTTFIALTASASNAANTAGAGSCGRIIMANPTSSSNFKHCYGVNVYYNGASLSFLSAGGLYGLNTNAINAAKFLFSSGNIATGQIDLYGIKG